MKLKSHISLLIFQEKIAPKSGAILIYLYKLLIINQIVDFIF